jgi:hypothetical protein
LRRALAAMRPRPQKRFRNTAIPRAQRFPIMRRTPGAGSRTAQTGYTAAVVRIDLLLLVGAAMDVPIEPLTDNNAIALPPVHFDRILGVDGGQIAPIFARCLLRAVIGDWKMDSSSPANSRRRGVPRTSPPAAPAAWSVITRAGYLSDHDRQVELTRRNTPGRRARDRACSDSC